MCKFQPFISLPLSGAASSPAPFAGPASKQMTRGHSSSGCAAQSPHSQDRAFLCHFRRVNHLSKLVQRGLVQTPIKKNSNLWHTMQASFTKKHVHPQTGLKWGYKQSHPPLLHIWMPDTLSGGENRSSTNHIIKKKKTLRIIQPLAFVAHYTAKPRLWWRFTSVLPLCRHLMGSLLSAGSTGAVLHSHAGMDPVPATQVTNSATFIRCH